MVHVTFVPQHLRSRMSIARVTVMALAVLTALAIATPAQAITYTNYWGFNNLTKTNPPAGTCSGQGAAIACSGFNNTPPHDTTFIQINSGNATLAEGFQNCQGCAVYYGNAGPSAGAWELTWSQLHNVYPGLGTYNRVTCMHRFDEPTYSYCQCRWGDF
jgi:hypothetical protein